MGVKLAAMFAAMFVIYGVSLTYLPVWLDARGLSPAEIAFATSAPLFLRLVVTPTIGFAADRANAHRTLLLALSASAGLFALLLAQAPTGWALIGLTALMLVAMQTMMPLADTIAMSAARADAAIDYGRVRLWGSLTFILASYVAGFTAANAGAGTIIWLMVAGAVLTTAALLALPDTRRRQTKISSSKSGSTSAATPRLRPADVLHLARNRAFLLFLVASGTIQCSHAVFYVFGVLHWREQGLGAGLIGSLWAIGVLAEIALFWAGRRVARLGDTTLIAVGAVAGIVRWCAMAFDPPATLLIPLQILHAGTFAATHLGAMQWIAANVPAHMAGSAQALLSTFTAGIAMSSATLLSGPLYTAMGGGAYAAMAILCMVGLVAALALKRQAAPRGSAP